MELREISIPSPQRVDGYLKGKGLAKKKEIVELNWYFQRGGRWQKGFGCFLEPHNVLSDGF